MFLCTRGWKFKKFHLSLDAPLPVVGFSLTFIFKCCCRLCVLLNDLEHCKQIKGRPSSVWNPTWYLRPDNSLKDLKHNEQLNGFSPSRVNSCMFLQIIKAGKRLLTLVTIMILLPGMNLKMAHKVGWKLCTMRATMWFVTRTKFHVSFQTRWIYKGLCTLWTTIGFLFFRVIQSMTLKGTGKWESRWTQITTIGFLSSMDSGANLQTSWSCKWLWAMQTVEGFFLFTVFGLGWSFSASLCSLKQKDLNYWWLTKTTYNHSEKKKNYKHRYMYIFQAGNGIHPQVGAATSGWV